MDKEKYESIKAKVSVAIAIEKLAHVRETFKKAVVIFLQDNDKEKIEERVVMYKSETISALKKIIESNKVLNLPSDEIEAMILHTELMQTPTVEEIEVKAKRAMTRDSMLNPDAKIFSDN